MHLPTEQLLAKHRVSLVSKKNNGLMRFLGKALIFNDRFMDGFWTVITLGPMRIIAYPTRYKTREQAVRQRYTIIHEIQHVIQADRQVPQFKTLSNIIFALKYVFLPAPALSAYYRYKYEIEAYLVSYRARVEEKNLRPTKVDLDKWVDRVANSLWKYYFFTVPPSVTRRRLKKELSDLYARAS